MVAKRIVRALTVVAAGAAALAVGCSKSATGPGDPFAGSWGVTVQNFIYNGDVPPDTGTVTPSPFLMTVSKNGASYKVSWPALTWNVTISATARQLPIPPSDSLAYSVTTSGDTLIVHIPRPDVGTGCEFDVVGAYTGSSAEGSLDIVGGTCGTLGGAEVARGSWSAAKQ